MAWYFATYQPLCFTAAGRRAIEQHGHQPFVDFSCRREPDLEAATPSISALCRTKWFAPKLKRGDVVVYLSKKGRYGTGAKNTFWHVVAVLKVRRTFDSHPRAAAWYRKRRQGLPRNCIVAGNGALPLDHTGETRATLKTKSLTYGRWVALYRKRARDVPAFVGCEALYVRLDTPRILRTSQAKQHLGHSPVTQTPKAEPEANVRKLLTAAGVRLRPRRRR